MSIKPHGIMFHHFHDDDLHIKGQGSIDQNEFRKMILLLREDFNLLSAGDWCQKAIESRLEENDICLTFDDNLKCQFDIALPVLEEFDLKAFWFVYTSPLEGIIEKLEIYRYFRFSEFNNINDFYDKFHSTLTRSKYDQLVNEGLKTYSNDFLKHFSFYTEEDKLFRFTRDYILGTKKYHEVMEEMIYDSKVDIKEVSKNLWNDEDSISYLNSTDHVIGLHSHSHPTQLSQLSYEKQREEYNKCYDILFSQFGKDIIAMSHPCNSYNSDTLKILKDLDINLGFRSNMEDGYSSKLEYPRLDHAYLIDKI